MYSKFGGGEEMAYLIPWIYPILFISTAISQVQTTKISQVNDCEPLSTDLPASIFAPQ